ncbi:deoxynucleoside triphosphate triphosphohydrolase SAMHD1-like isoform X1 [Acropora muricata]|uniref:deoxynucleoside triphosphate triphosphohydrolase SAMHD1-like isoform X1 n=1 Tax=Acropora muricata TaxID=159855 RepID=UPI0034E49651
MHRGNRKRKVATVTPPDRKVLRTPSPKRPRETGVDFPDEKVDHEVKFVNSTSSEDYSHKVFNDSIHGHIEVHPLCVKIIDTPQFQRLRNIKQLGGCYYVFPGASHNRFEHCIGTCHLAGKLVRGLQKRQPELGITNQDILCVKVAGLCHDLGHGPFSHMFDALFIPAARPGVTWKHEIASVMMFDHMVEVNDLLPTFQKYDLTEKDVIFIKELIAGTALDSDGDQEWLFKGREPNKRYLYEIVANKRTGIDVDKFDYFSRDCHNLGISNSFDHKRYMKFARVIDVKGKRQICVRDKEAGNLYDMFHTRNSLFRRAYQHKTSNIIERMISEALLKADDKLRLKGKNGKMLSISESIDDMEAYTQLTDHVYHQILCSYAPELEEARFILQRIEKRDLYKCIGQTILKSPRDKEEIPDITESIVNFWQGGPHITADDFIVEIVTFDYGMRDRNPMDELRFYAKNAPDVPMIKRKDEVSSMLPEMFAEQNLRVYFRRTDPEDLDKAKRCFVEWCLGQQCTTPKGGDALVDLTPMKSSQDMDRRLSYTE